MKTHRGFSLLEIVVALAIFATATLSMLAFSTRIVQQQTRLEQKTLALWVAENTLAELRMQQPWPRSGYHEYRVKNMGQQWRVDVRVQDTTRARLRRIQVDVFAGQDSASLASLTGYRGEH